MKRNILMLISCVLLFSVLSCDGLFTTTLGGWAERDLDKVLESASAKEIADFLLSPQALSKKDSKKIINALANKSASELLSLSGDQKTVIVNTSIAAILPDASVVGGLVSFGDDTSKDLIDTAISSINTDVNTSALTVLLGDPNLDTVEDDAVLLGTLCLVGSIASKNNVDLTDSATADTVAKSVDAESGLQSSIGATDQESDAIINATQVFEKSDLYKDLNIDISDFIK